MGKHRTLSLEAFVKSISWEFFRRYFDKHVKKAPQEWVLINADAMQQFLDDPVNAEDAGNIQEDFQRINDIAQEGMNILVRTCQKYNIEIVPDENPAQLSMRLFLDYSEAFEFAWSRYLLYDSAARLSIYPLHNVESLVIGSTEIEAFQEGVQRWFAELAKGDKCRVRPYEDQGEIVILVRHGAYIRTVPFWEGDDVSFNSFRPAIEDVLVYDPTKSQLFIKSALAKDREQYLRLFASCIVGDERIADQAIKDEIFTLAPLQQGSFNFSGGGPIIKIDLVKIRMKLYGVSSPVIDLRARDIQDAFKHDLGSLTINSGVLTMARFHFHLRFPNHKLIKVTFEIEPPSRTNLAQKRYAQVIEEYLLEQGVKLH